jgi:hypothetical protein
MKTFRQFITEAKRMRVLRTAHYTSRENKNSILKSGFKESPSSGTYHPEKTNKTVYTTPTPRVGNDYGYSRVNLKFVNPKVKNTISHKKSREKKKELLQKYEGEELMKRAKKVSPIQQSREYIKKGHKIVRVPDAHNAGAKAGKGSYIMVDIDTANKNISKNAPPTIRAKDKPQRTKTQPKRR